MKYVISDIHGEYNLFLKMLELIKFSKKDILYINGDVFDRGLGALDIVSYIQSHSNIHLIKGNHEQMFLDCIEKNDPYEWIYMGGTETYNSIVKKGPIFVNELYKYIKGLPYYLIVDNFILVHAGLNIPSDGDNFTIEELIDMYGEENMLWSKSLVGNERKYKNYFIICGNTPTQRIEQNKQKDKIYHTNGTIYINGGCGCGFENEFLNCLRLNDFKEFFVNNL